MLSDQNAALIECAATLMQLERIEDAHDALRRAAKRLNLSPNRWPKAEQVRLALLARLDLFDPDRAARILSMRHAALEAIAFFHEFQPRAVGGIVDGSAAKGSAIQFECRCEHPERLQQRLFELKIPALQLESLKAGTQRTRFEFTAGAFNFQLNVLAEGERGFPVELCADANKLTKLIQMDQIGTSSF